MMRLGGICLLLVLLLVACATPSPQQPQPQPLPPTDTPADASPDSASADGADVPASPPAGNPPSPVNPPPAGNPAPSEGAPPDGTAGRTVPDAEPSPTPGTVDVPASAPEPAVLLLDPTDSAGITGTAGPVLTSGIAEDLMEEMLPGLDLPLAGMLPPGALPPAETENGAEPQDRTAEAGSGPEPGSAGADAADPGQTGSSSPAAGSMNDSNPVPEPVPRPSQPEVPAAPTPVAPPSAPAAGAAAAPAPEPGSSAAAPARPAADPPPRPAAPRAGVARPSEPRPAPAEPARPVMPPPARSQPSPAAESVPAPGPSVAAASRAAPARSATADPAAGTIRRIYGRPGDDIDVNFPGSGWLFLGIEGGERGIEFLRRSAAPESTSFLFRALDLGEYRISFQRQDMVAGEILEERILVSVLPPDDFTRAVAAAGSRANGDAAQQGGGTPATSAAGSADGAGQTAGTASVAGSGAGRSDAKQRIRDEAERLFRAGKYPESIERLRSLGGDDPEITDRIAEAYRLGGSEAEAVPFWERNLDAGGEWADRAQASLYSAAIRRKDRGAFDRYLPAVLEGLGSVPVDGLILSGARYREEDGDVPGAIELYREYLDRNPADGDPGEAWYRLGRLYESEGPHRDLKTALQAYRTVHDRYPVSAFWRPARERMQYLNRHIFDLR